MKTLALIFVLITVAIAAILIMQGIYYIKQATNGEPEQWEERTGLDGKTYWMPKKREGKE